jgi:hypothetical protein
MGGFLHGITRILPSYLALIRALPGLLPALPDFFRAIITALHSCRIRKHRSDCCFHIPATEYKRADPMIYCQSYYMAQGLSVTWDNPDIELFRGGTPVSSSALEADTEYEVVVRVWNGSYDGPAIDLPVELSFLSFGAGTISHHIDTQLIDLGVKGAPNCPAFAQFKWRTPAAEGHYCLQARLMWSDDANPDNNLGQENVEVGRTHSPAQFQFQLRNADPSRRLFELEADSYRLPELPLCPPDGPEPPPADERGRVEGRTGRLAESRRRWAEALKRHGRGTQPVEAGWSVTIKPDVLELDPWEEVSIEVLIEPDDPDFTGRHSFNIACFASVGGFTRQPAGGVTLYVERG